MISNYILVAWRNLIKNPVFSLINIIGLAIGMAAAVLIWLWIKYEYDFDAYHHKKDRIYQAWNKSADDGKIVCWGVTPQVMAGVISKDFDEVEHTARENWVEEYLFKYEDWFLLL